MDHDPTQPPSSDAGPHAPLSESPPGGQQAFPHDHYPPRRSRMRRTAIVLLLLLLLIPAGALVRSVFFSTVVTTLSADGPGSLRWDIASAIPGSTIRFDPHLRGTILLTSGDLRIEKNLKILGPGADKLSISSGNSGHCICVFYASVTISGLTFKDSNPRLSFIFNQGGTLTLSNSIVSGNSGGGIFNQGGTLTLSNSIVSGNTGDIGGGIANEGTLTITNSTVADNTATEQYDGGGGIYNKGTLTLSNSTISGNMATGQYSAGGGIYNEGRLTLSNSTISGNNSSGDGGGIAISDLQNSRSGGVPVPVMLYCTVYGNTADLGGGIWVGNLPQGQVMTMGASIVALNKARTAPDIAGPLATLGYNLVGNRSGATLLGSSHVQSTDVFGVSSTALLIDPRLRDNGGPTKTHALLPGSPAIDLIPPDVCMMFGVESDQRGVKRPQGKSCDSGAYEYVPSP